jgi:hypothetical protein
MKRLLAAIRGDVKSARDGHTMAKDRTLAGAAVSGRTGRHTTVGNRPIAVLKMRRSHAMHTQDDDKAIPIPVPTVISSACTPLNPPCPPRKCSTSLSSAAARLPNVFT